MNLLLGDDGITANGDPLVFDPAAYSTQPYLDTGLKGYDSTDVNIADGGVITSAPVPGSVSPPGDFTTAAVSGGGTTQPTPDSPSFLDKLNKAFNNAASDIATGSLKAGTNAIDSAVATVNQASNPLPSNSNTNLANKGVSAKAGLLQQSIFGAQGSFGLLDPVTKKVNWGVALVLGAIGLFVVAIFLRRG